MIPFAFGQRTIHRIGRFERRMREAAARIDKKAGAHEAPASPLHNVRQGRLSKVHSGARHEARAVDASMQAGGRVAGSRGAGAQGQVAKALMTQPLRDGLADVRHIGGKLRGRIGVGGARAVDLDIARKAAELVFEKTPHVARGAALGKIPDEQVHLRHLSARTRTRSWRDFAIMRAASVPTTNRDT
jgi:hypothetical protein